MLDFVNGRVFDPADFVIRTDGDCGENGADGSGEGFDARSSPVKIMTFGIGPLDERVPSICYRLRVTWRLLYTTCCPTFSIFSNESNFLRLMTGRCG
jgi:hypothetical protein